MNFIKKISPKYALVFMYTLIGMLWILLSDHVLLYFVKDIESLSAYQSYKGWAFILFTASFLYLLLLWYEKIIYSTTESKEQIEKKFNLLYEDAPNPYQSLDINGNILAVNQKWLDLLGYEKHEIIGKWFGDILTPSNLTHFKKNFTRFKNNGTVQGVEYEVLHKDGTIIQILLHGQIAYHNDPTLLKTHCAFENISDRHKLEHLNKVSKLIRDVNQAIVRIKDRETLLQESCDILISSNLYNYAWINITQNPPLSFYYSSQREEEFQALKSKLNTGWTPSCIKLLQEQNKPYLYLPDTNHSCPTCPLRAHDISKENGHILELSHNNKHYGYLAVSSINQFDEEELELLIEVAGDIAYGIFNLETEQILKDNEERYRFAVEGAKEGLWDWDLLNDTIYMSPRYKEILGYRDDELESTFNTWVEHLHPDDKDQVILDIKKSQNKQNKEYQNIHRLRHKDGHWVWVNDRAQTIFDENGIAVRMIGSHSDISNLKQVENALQVSNEKFKNVFNHAPIIIILTKLKTGEIYDVNETFKTKFGYQKEEVIGKTTFDIDLWCKPEDRQKYINDFHQHSFINGDTYTFYTKEKAQIIAKVYSSLVVIDKEEYILAVAEDITEQNKIYNLLQDSQEISHLGSWEQNTNAETLLWSDEVYRIFELDSKKGITFDRFLERVHPDDRSSVVDTFEKSIQEHNKYFLKHRLLFPDGSIKYVVERGEHFYDKNSNRIHTTGTVQDITEQLLAEDEIKKRDAILTSVFQVIPDLLFIMDQEGVIIDYKAKINTDLYLEPKLFLGKKIQDILPPDVQEVISQNLRSIEANSALKIFKYELEIKGGIRHFEARMAQLPLDNNVMTIIRDITEQVSYEQQLVFQSQLLEQSLAATSVVDENNMFSYVNDAFVKMWGYESKEEILGTSPRDYCLDPNMARSIIKKVGTKGSHLFSFKAQKKDGTTFDALMATQYLEYMNKKHYLSSVMDITEQQENLNQLQQKKSELETIIQEAPNPMILHEEGGKILMLNQAWINASGFTLDEIPTIYDFVEHAYDDENIKMRVKNHIQSLYQITEKVEEGDFTFLNKNKDTLTWQFSSAPLGIMDTKQIVITSAMDITELKRKDQMLINQSRHAAMGEMIGMIAHQWRQPLSTISMDANNMLLDIALDALDITTTKAYAQSISTQTQHLSQTIDDFRNFFKPDKVISKVNLGDILTQTLSIVADSLKNNNITLTSTIETDYKVNAYPRELMQVFVNIITNSKDALISCTESERLITVKIYESEKYINVEICDNGGGIELDILPKIFDPYFSTKDEKTGTGLGLYMSKMIIQEHLHGMVEAHNQNNGTCFTVSLLK